MCNKFSFSKTLTKKYIKNITLDNGGEYTIINLDKDINFEDYDIKFVGGVRDFVVKHGQVYVIASAHDTLIYKGKNLVSVIPAKMRDILHDMMTEKDWEVDMIDHPCDGDQIHAVARSARQGMPEVHSFDGGFRQETTVIVPVAENGNKIGMDVTDKEGWIEDSFVCYGRNSKHVFCMLYSDDSYPMSRCYVAANKPTCPPEAGQPILLDRMACVMPIEVANELEKVAPLFSIY